MDNEVTIRIKGDSDLSKVKGDIADLKAKARELAREKIRIDADVDQAKAKIAELRRELKSGTSGRTKLEIDADVAAAEAALAELQRRAREISRERATISVDTGAASAKLAALRAEADTAVSAVDGKTAHVNVDADVGAALAKIALVGAALAGLGAAAGAVGAGVGLGAVAAGGIGAAVAGLAGIGGAVKALGEQTKGAGAAASHAAGQQLQMAAAVDRVKQAQAALGNTRAQIADDVRRESEAEQRAIERVTDAQRTLGHSQDDLRHSQQGLVEAQQDLNRARADAQRQLRDLARAQQDMALQQRGALLDVEDAKARLDDTLIDPRATDLQRRQAQLAYDEAVQQNEDLKDQATDLASRKADADRKGVAGSDQVAEANRRLASAQQGVVAAQEDVAAATRGVADAQREVASVQADTASRQRDDAFKLAQAEQSVIDAQRGVQQASISAGSAGAAAADKVADAMAGLSPAAQGFARFLRGFIDGPIAQLRRAGQEGLLPGLQKGLESLGPIISQNLPAFKAFATVVGDALGGIVEVAGKLAPPLMRMATVVLQAMAPLQGVLAGFGEAFGKVIDQMSADGSMQAAVGAFVDLFGALLMALPPLLPPMTRLAITVLPVLTRAVQIVTGALTGLLTWMAKHAPGAVATASGVLSRLGGVVQRLVPVLKDLAEWFMDHVLPAIQSVAGSIREGLMFAVHTITDAFNRNRASLVALANFIVGKVVPVIGVLLKGALMIVGTAIGIVIDTIGWLVRAFQTVWRWGGTVAGAFKAIGAAARGVWTDVTTWFGRILDFVRGLPGRIASATVGMWDGIKNAFRTAINWIISQWNGLQFTLPGFTLPFPPHTTFGGLTIGVPDIPYLASGGIASGFAMVGERGREIVRLPAGSSVRSAPDTERDLAAGASGRLVLEWAGAPSGALERAVFEWLRNSIRVKTGGDVQAALGR